MSEWGVYPTLLDWPVSVTSLQETDRSYRVLRLNFDFDDYDVLPHLPDLRTLWCFGVNENKWRRISSCSGLQRLFVKGLKVRDFSRVYYLTALEVLSLEDCSLITELDSIKECHRLRGLGISNFKNVHSLKPLENMVELRHLAVTGGMWARMTIDSLEPLSSLTNLEWVDLGNTNVADGSLKPLGEMNHLHYLNLPNFFPMEEYAWLSGRLPGARCTWFDPFIEISFLTCKKCGSSDMVMLTGKRKPKLCKRCDGARLRKHVEEFRRIADRSKLAE